MCGSVPTGCAGKGRVETGVQGVVLAARFDRSILAKDNLMNRIVYIVGAIVIILAVLSFFGLR
jgi:hypothetical protein